MMPPDFEDDGAAAEAARRAFGARIMAEDRAQYLTVGIQLGERYETSPIVCADCDARAARHLGQLHAARLGRARARRMSGWRRAAPLYDEFGQGFTLIDFGAPAGADALAAAARARGVPLTTLRLDAPDGLYRRKLVLVRPDQHIAWHGDAVVDAAAVIDRVRGA